MSQTANGAVRCDGCGRISRNPIGEYQNPDGSLGYIVGTPFWGVDVDDGKDWCQTCGPTHAGKEHQPVGPKVGS